MSSGIRPCPCVDAFSHIIAFSLVMAVYILTGSTALLAVVAGALVYVWRTEAGKRKALVERFQNVVDAEAEIQSIRDRFSEESKSHEEAKKHVQQFFAAHQAKREKLEARYKAALGKYQGLKGQVGLLEESLEDMSFGLYEPHFTFDTAEEYKEALRKCRAKQKQFIRKGDAIHALGNWTVEGSRAKGEKMERQYSKVMLRAFNGECDAAVAKVTWNNATKMVQRIEKAYEAINKLGEVMKIEVSRRYLKAKIEEVELTHEHQDKRQQEREEEREQRAQMREQERAEREIERAQLAAEKEERRQQAALDKARAEADNATGAQLKKLTEQIASLEKKVGEAQTQKERAKARAQLTRSGFVYVLSNQGSFGEGVVKIGMTRRMEPMDRVKELSDASVPFPFDVHVMMFSEDAPDLERSLQEHFSERRVNLVNFRKEYFRNVELDEVESFIRERGVTAQFKASVEAREYRETQAALLDKAKADEDDEAEAASVADSLFGDEGDDA